LRREAEVAEVFLIFVTFTAIVVAVGMLAYFRYISAMIVGCLVWMFPIIAAGMLKDQDAWAQNMFSHTWMFWLITIVANVVLTAIAAIARRALIADISKKISGHRLVLRYCGAKWQVGFGGVTMPWLRMASIVVWSIAALLAFVWIGLIGFEYLSGSCHGVQECSATASFLNNAFFLFFALGILIDGTERLIGWRGGPRA
jgi:hypothetical protein